jgi:inhibitor of growth protein 1
LTQALIAAQELGDEKLQVSQQLNDLIEMKTRQLDQDHKNLDYGKDDLAEAQQQQKENRVQSPVLPLPITTSTSTAQQQYSMAPANPPSSAVLTSNQSNNSSSYASNGSNSSSVERSSKRARRTRTDTNAGSGMEVDIETTIKVEAISVVKPMSSVASVSVVQTSTSSASSSGQKKGSSGGSGKKKKRKTGRQSNSNQSSAARDDTPPPEEAIDPDEPTYCLCDQISFGEMILCDNDLCPIEWFHFSCVALMTKPKGKWYCPNCREKNKPTVMKAKAQFLKELERYNRDKEEKISNASNALA